MGWWKGAFWTGSWWSGSETVADEDVQEVHLWANGPLAITGAPSGAALQVSGVGRRKVTVSDGVAEVHLWGPMQVRVPDRCVVRVRRVNGPLAVKGLGNDVYLESINGPVTGRGVGSVTVGQVRGPLALREVQGSVTGEGPRGPLTMEDVHSDVRLTSPVRGALILRRVSGSVDLEVRGHAHFAGPVTPGQKVRLKVHGDLRLDLPTDADVRIAAQVGGTVEAPVVGEAEAGAWVATLGEGAATMDLEVDGDLRLSLGAEEALPEEAGEADWADFWPEFPAAGFWSRTPTGRGVARRARADDEERLAVLRMLAEKKITAEEAERLLQALEGKE